MAAYSPEAEVARRAFRKRHERITRAECLMAKAATPGPTARHEAAHAVVAIRAGIRCHKLVLHPEGGGKAFLEKLPDIIERKRGTDPKRQARWRAIACLAGGVVDPTVSPSSPVDRALARAELKSVGLGIELLDELRAEAKRMVAKYRRDIDRVAAALQGAGELDEADIKALLQLRSGDRP